MIPNVDETILYNEFGSHRNDLLVPSPQALWIKVNQFRDRKRPETVSQQGKLLQHYQFTDTIIQPSESLCTNSQAISGVQHSCS